MHNDPATLEIIRSNFNSIAESMGHVIERTSYTTFVKESADYATALATPEGDFFVYPRTAGVTIFLSLHLKKAIEACEPLEPGDIIITNDPYSTDGVATHLPDVHIIKPIFIDNELLCYAWSFVHCSDVGGLVPSSISPTATDIHQEGLRIPPVKLYEKGKINPTVRNILDVNSRVPNLNLGDFNAMVAAVNTGEIRMTRIVEKFGMQTIQAGMYDLLHQGRERAKKVIEKIPDGTYSFADYLDDDMLTNIPLRLAVDLTVSEGSMTIDFSKCDPQVKSAFNLVTNETKHSFMLQGIINYIISSDPFIPVNTGIVHPIEVIAPKGTVVNAEYPSAVGIRHSITMRLYNVLLGALSQAIPDNIPAAGAGQAAIVVVSTPDDNTGSRNMAVVEPLGGGGGGQSNLDGIDGIDHASAFLKNTPIESLEQHIEILVHKYEFLPNTAGAGLYRGGNAIRLDFEILQEDSIVTARGMERMRFRPWGLAGGSAGSIGNVLMNPDSELEKTIPKIDILKPEKGDIVSLRTPGGGGWGSPIKRDPNHVLSDVKEKLLDVEEAKKQYGVSLTYNEDNHLTIDYEQTEQLRKSMLETSTSLWDFGKERVEYEARWTPEGSDTLALHLQEFPPSKRWNLKNEVHAIADDKFSNIPITSDVIKDIWQVIVTKYKN